MPPAVDRADRAQPCGQRAGGQEELRGERASLMRGGRSSVVAMGVCKQAGMNFSSGNNGAVFCSLP